MIAVGIGVGGPLGLYGALLHTFNHAAGKALLFCAAGRVQENFGTLELDRISGMARTLRWTSAFLVVGVMAIIGLPPFSLFVSEFAILTAAFRQEQHWIVASVLLAVVIGFGALIFQLQRMLAGEPAVARKAVISLPGTTPMAPLAAPLILLVIYFPLP